MRIRSTLAATFLLAGTGFATAQTVVVTPEQEVIVREARQNQPGSSGAPFQL